MPVEPNAPDTAHRRSQAERRADSERRLLRASAELIVERGLDRTSLADIGRRAGASHAAVNHRFGSKDELVDRLIEEAGSYYADVAGRRLAGLHGLDALVGLARLYLELVRSADPLGRVHIVLWSEAISQTADRRAAHLAWDRLLHRTVLGLLRDAERLGQADPGTATTETAASIVGMLRGIAMQLLLDPEDLDLDETTRTVATVIRDAARATG